LERENIRMALTSAIETGNAALAVQLVAYHPHRQSEPASLIGEISSLPASRVLDLAGAAEQPGYHRVLMVAAYDAVWSGEHEIADELYRQALDTERQMRTPIHGPQIEIEGCAMRAQASLSAGAYADAVTAYYRAAELAGADEYPGLAAIYLAYGVGTALLGGFDLAQAIATAEESVALARRSGMRVALVLSLNALALTLVDRDPARARSLLLESVELSCVPGEVISPGFVTAALVAGRLGDWALTLAVTARSMSLYRWNFAPLHAATCFAECARAFAENHPELAGRMQGAAYAAFRRANPAGEVRTRTDSGPDGSHVNFVLTALHEAGDLVATALGDERAQKLRAEGAALSTDEAISYALANIDPQLLTGPLASIVR
jgi:tetratricopeptide (TPR) repeat protein